MILMVCLDNQNGIAFNHRRQSLDSIVTDDIVRTAAQCGHKLYISTYSQSLLAKQTDMDTEVWIGEDPFAAAGKGDFVFLEQSAADLSDPKIEELIVYRWNRDYPSDVKLAIGKEWELFKTTDFKGHSHEKITKEQYRRSNSCQKS